MPLLPADPSPEPVSPDPEPPLSAIDAAGFAAATVAGSLLPAEPV
ncbi:hypothetical protein ABZ319_01335 [Nocardia sp. NPDC005978]